MPQNHSAQKRWIAETLFDDLGFRMSYAVDKVLYEMQTEHQHLVLFEQPFFGKMLMLDGATQISKKDEFIYQEMMSHVPLFAHGKPENVLIIGGGDCGIAEEVLKHRTVKRLTQVEIEVAASRSDNEGPVNRRRPDDFSIHKALDVFENRVTVIARFGKFGISVGAEQN